MTFCECNDQIISNPVIFALQIYRMDVTKKQDYGNRKVKHFHAHKKQDILYFDDI